MLIVTERELPPTALVDTGVFARFLGKHPEDLHAATCVEFCQSMLDRGHELFVAAPTIAELLRGRDRPIPRIQGLTVVPFDADTTQLLALEQPATRLQAARQASGREPRQLGHDAMISACALRCRTQTLITLDVEQLDHFVVARQLGLDVLHPGEFNKLLQMFRD